MDFSLTTEQELLRKEIVRFAEGELNPGSRERDRDQAFPHPLWRKCGEMGLLGLPVSEEYGGQGLDPLTTALALEALGYGCRDGGLVFAVGAHLLACVVPIWLHGSEAQKRRYLPGLCKGDLIAAHAMTEATSGSDAFSMATRAAADGGGFRINGAKTMCSNGPVADLAVVYAATDPDKGSHGGITAFLIPAASPGVLRGQKFEKMGLRSCCLGELAFQETPAAADAVLVPDQCEYLALEGLGQLMETLDLVREGLNSRLQLLGIVLTMHDSRTNLSSQVVEEVRTHFPRATFESVIPRSVRLSEAPSYGQPARTYDPASRGALAYASLAEELLKKGIRS